MVVVVREGEEAPPLPLPVAPTASPAGGEVTAGVGAVHVLPAALVVVLVLGLMMHSVAAVSAERPCRRLSVSWWDVSEEEEEMPPPDEKGATEVEEEVEEEGLLGGETASPEKEDVVPSGSDGGFETGSSLALFLLLALSLVLALVPWPASRTWPHARETPAAGLLGSLVISCECTMD